ncbi:ATP-binding protein [Texcoconibacillus texcoconensis]|uniref:histidine kinase n=1 Tax=Texcoconibacillus texcoconensis TaxID=1095777 RepID=A0A840QNI6_9BACI|nr:two-component system sensor histidine kinase ResE [Texcoconibacillus texcoconensis]
MMFWRSVVGKLWATIILLMAVVLIVVTILLLQYFERFHTAQEEERLTNHASVIATVIEDADDVDSAVESAMNIAKNYSCNVFIATSEAEYWYSDQKGESLIPSATFFEDQALSAVFDHQTEVINHGSDPFFIDGQQLENEQMIVGIPVDIGGESGAVFMYQSLDVVEGARGETTNIILLSAGIAIILTTVFAFFLMTRITAPLRKMRKASLEVAKGNFDTKVPILTRDEIGLLGMAFNRMARALNKNITALNQEKEQLSRILSSMADGVITLDREGSLVVTNPPADQFIRAWVFEQGLSSEETPQIPKEIETLFNQVVELEKEQMVEVDVQGRSWVVLMTPLYQKSDVRGAVAVLRDMTEERMHDKLRKDFIANVSHELRTPISLLQGYSEAIVDDVVPSEEEKRELAQIIYDETLRMGRLVNELLDIARMEAGHITLNRERFSLNDFAERIMNKFQASANDHNVQLISNIENKEIDMDADPDRLEQVLTNLIDNAFRHTSEGGKVLLNIRSDDEGVQLDVTDTGSGIAEEDLPFVFERFYKADKARTRGHSGTGLGLAIVKNIVEAHRGQVSAHSKLGEGTTFSVYIPYGLDDS